MKTTRPDSSTVNEEWLARYRKVAERIERRVDDVTNENDVLHSAAIAARAGLVGEFDCLLMEESDGHTEELLGTIKRSMDEDASSNDQINMLERIVNQSDASRETTRIKLETVEVDVNVFFDEYPECSQADRSASVYEDDDNEDNLSFGSSEQDYFLKNSIEPTGNYHPSSRSNIYNKDPQPLQERPSTSYTRIQSSLNRHSSMQRKPQQTNATRCASTDCQVTGVPQRNPYRNDRSHREDAGRFSYTPPTQSVPSTSSTTLKKTWSYDQPSHSHAVGSTRDSYQPTRPPPHGSISNGSSWEDHRSQQNPFQTAREFAATECDDSSNRKKNSNSDSGNSWQKSPSDSYLDSTRNQCLSKHPRGNEENYRSGGPTIPESLKRKFQPPKREKTKAQSSARNKPASADSSSNGGVKGRPTSPSDDSDEDLPEELKALDKELVKKIQNEIMESGETITFNDIAGLKDAKQTVLELVCWPMKRPDLFTGLRRAPNGLLLYGPPGTGKTLIGKAIAHESGATFFSISSSSLTSKWIGEGEKLVRTLFAVAAYREPAVVFIDEIDSLLTQRKASENEASRRIKTEFLVQLDGTGTSGQGRVLVIGATNRPQELDEAARRRFVKRLYIPLPAEEDREILLHTMLAKNKHKLTDQEILRLSQETEGFSGADLKALCGDAAMGPIRQLGQKALEIHVDKVPPISFKHFRRSLKGVKPSVAPSDLVQYEEWDRTYGSKRAMEGDEDDESDEDIS